MPTLEAHASGTVFKKNLIIVAMCVGFLGWFAYDGWVAWPARNDRLVAVMKDMLDARPGQPAFKPEYATQIPLWRGTIEAWDKQGGWNGATSQEKQDMYNIAQRAKESGPVGDFKSPLDIAVQRWIVFGLIAVSAASIWWVIHCQKRRVIADENTVSPEPGVVIPWNKITVVDNTRWKSSGIVEITYTGEDNQPHKAKFDDYIVEREPLLHILDLLAEKADKAEFIPKEEAAPPETQPAA